MLSQGLGPRLQAWVGRHWDPWDACPRPAKTSFGQWPPHRSPPAPTLGSSPHGCCLLPRSPGCGRPGVGEDATASQHPACLAGHGDLPGLRDKSKRVSSSSTRGTRPAEHGSITPVASSRPQPYASSGLPSPSQQQRHPPRGPRSPPRTSSPSSSSLRLQCAPHPDPVQRPHSSVWTVTVGVRLSTAGLPAPALSPEVFPTARMNLCQPGSDIPFP